MSSPTYYILRSTHYRRGFIALTATIIVSAVLLALVIAVASKGFYGRFNVLDAEVKEVSRALAEGCVETAKLKHAEDNTYTGDNDPVSVGGRECIIISVTGPLTAVEVRTQAVVNDTYTNLEVVFDATDAYSMSSWEEVPNF